MSELVLIKNFPNRAFAEQAQKVLEARQIPSVLKSPDTGIFGTSSVSVASGVDLYVDEENSQKAAELLNALYDGI
ncbi:MAG TPA: hypothetical protein ENK44_08940 [Caldithrix abyssi]|uniref:DUF2007 domain-containing protein n=1 Tax=Caldithrix abyssi TaxID=187145 RepID=A0A7V4U0S8_CALAY|nr:hypothetical protein [Caldithrix abyssi]